MAAASSHKRLRTVAFLSKRQIQMESAKISEYIEQLQDDNLEDEYVRWSAADALAKIGTPAIPALIKVFKNERLNARLWAARALGKMGIPALPALLAALKDDAPEIRQGAVIALENVGHSSAVPFIIEALKDADEWVRSDAAIALGTLGDLSATPLLLEMLSDPEACVRQSAIEGMGRLGDTSVVTFLAATLKSEDQELQAPAATALGEIGDTSAVPSLIEALNGSSHALSTVAGQALWKIGDPPTLARKVIADSRFSAQMRIDVLAALRRAYYKYKRDSRFAFPATREACEALLTGDDADGRRGAQTVLNWLNGDRHLLIASKPDKVTEAQQLLRATRGGIVETQTGTLLRPTEKPE